MTFHTVVLTTPNGVPFTCAVANRRRWVTGHPGVAMMRQPDQHSPQTRARVPDDLVVLQTSRGRSIGTTEPIAQRYGTTFAAHVKVMAGGVDAGFSIRSTKEPEPFTIAKPTPTSQVLVVRPTPGL